jgi:hypothetical protein
VGEQARQSVFGADRVHIDPAHPAEPRIALDQEIAPIVPKTDTEFVKHIRIRSELLSKFWGRDVYLGAHVLVPKDFDAHPEAHYPAHGVSRPLSGRHLGLSHDAARSRPEARLFERFHLAGYNRIQQQEAYAFYQKWISADFRASSWSRSSTPIPITTTAMR